MKKLLLLALFRITTSTLGSTAAFAQETDKVLRVNIINPGLEYDHPFFMRKAFVLLFLFLFLTSGLYAQRQTSDNSIHTKLRVQSNYLPTFTSNSITADNAASQGISLWFSDLEGYGVELGGHIFRGFHSSVDFSYGGSLAVVLLGGHRHWLKGGFDIGQLALNDYRRERRTVGGVIEDRFPNYFKPYFEWEWGLNSTFSLILKTGYRIMSSGNEKVTDVDYEPHIVTGEPIFKSNTTQSEQRFYGSGFELGAGVSVTIY